MDIVLTHLLFFVVGIVQDGLIAYYYQSVSKHKKFSSAGLSFIVTIVNLLVLYGILEGLTDQVLSVIIVYALGNAVGTYIVVARGKKN